MAMLLRKVWSSVLARAASGAPDSAPSPRGRHAPPIEYHGTLSLGALDAVPTDVLVQILRLLGPAGAARSSAVCRAWRVLASDNDLWTFFLRLGPEPWDLVVFAEMHLAADPASLPRCVCRAAPPPLGST
jgi:actin-related protein 8, plant